MALLTSNASALVSGRSLFSEGKLMKIEMLRDTVVEGKPVAVGDVIKCSDDEGIKMCQMVSRVQLLKRQRSSNIGMT